MRTLVVLPTYNEAENLKPMVEAIFAQIPTSHILVVDDRSPDGTGEIADQLARDFPKKVYVLHRPAKDGLGKAYQAAFAQALKMGFEQIMQMDVDFSHPVSLLPKMIQQLDNHDFVLGSRYVPGGGTKNWSFKRKFISRMGNLYAKKILKLPIQDLTGGFKAFNRRVLEYLLQFPIESHGYNFQIEMTARALAAGFTCIEVPFLFTERRQGKSKMTKGIIFEAFWKIFRLRRILKNVELHPTAENQSGLKPLATTDT